MTARRVLARLRGEAGTTLVRSFLTLGLGFVSGILSARQLSVEDRGGVALLLTTFTLASLSLALGTNIALRVYLPADPRVTLAVFAKTSAALAIPIMAVSVGVALLVRERLPHTSVVALAVVSALGALSAFSAQQSIDVVNALGHPSKAALFAGVGAAVNAAGLVITWLVAPSLTNVLAVYCLGWVTTTVIVLVWHRSTSTAAPAAEPGGSRFLLLRGVQLLGVNLGQALALRLDQYFIGATGDMVGLGHYSVAAAHNAVGQTAGNAYGQIGMRDAAHGRLTAGRARQLMASSIAASALIAIALWLATPIVIPLLFGAAYEPSVALVRILAIGQVALAPFLIMTKMLAGLGRIKLASGSGWLLLGLLALTLAVAVPRFGVWGAAWGSLAVYAVVSLSVTVLGWRAFSPSRPKAQ